MSPWIVLLVLIALLQSTFLAQIRWLGVHPNLMLTVVVSWSLLRGGREGLSWGFIGGIILDLFSITPFGTFTIALTFTTFLTGLIEQTSFQTNRILPVALMFLLSPLFQLASMVSMQTLGWQVGWYRALSLLLPGAMLDALLILLIFPLVRRLSRLAGDRAIEWK